MTTELTKARAQPRVHRWVFWPAAIIIIVLATFAMTMPSTAEVLFASIQSQIIGYFNWYYVLIATGFVVFSL